MEPRVKAVVLGAGLGTRLRPLTDATPKCLLPIGGKPLLQIWLEQVQAAGVGEVLVNTHWLHEQVSTFLRSWPAGGMKVETFFEPQLLGSAGTLYANRSWAEDASEILILYADNLTTVDLRDVLSFHHNHELPFSLGVFRTPFPERCGIVQVNDDGVVLEFVEKPSAPRSNLAAGGVYVADPSFFRELPAPPAGGQPYDLGSHVLPGMAGRMKIFPIEGLLIDIGTPESYQEAQRVYSQLKVSV